MFKKLKNYFYLISVGLLLIVQSENLYAEEPTSTSATVVVTNSKPEEKIPILDVIKKIPETSILGLKTSFSKESPKWWAGIIASTLILYHNDEVILRDIQRDGRDLGIGNTDNTKAVLSLGEIDLLRLPTDTGSFMYFLGDGWTHFGIAGGSLANGYYSEDNRAYNTGLRLVHGMAVSAILKTPKCR